MGYRGLSRTTSGDNYCQQAVVVSKGVGIPDSGAAIYSPICKIKSQLSRINPTYHPPAKVVLSIV
jgi:hypothetical protein